MTPSNYDEAQERLEFLRERLKAAKDAVTDAQSEASNAQLNLHNANYALSKIRSEYVAHLERMVEAAAAEKAVRG